MNIKKAIVKVFSANFLQLVSGIIVGFVVPVILSIENYANLKTYTLFVSYIGLLHFGYLDGLYLKYGGKRINDVDKASLKGEHFVTLFLELLITIIIILVGFFYNNVVIMLFGITVLPANLSTFFKGIFQATGEFERYTKIINTYTILYTAINLILVMILRVQEYVYYCFAVIVSHIIAVVFIEIDFFKKYKGIKLAIPNDIPNVIKTGVIILFGNLAVVALLGMDKVFVKAFLNTEDFAYYSFAVSMLNIINTLVNAISVTFYNYLFSINNAENSINKAKKYLITLGGAASAGYFVLVFIVNTFIKKYINSLPIIAITFSIFPYMILINALYVNLYKVNKNEKKYFKIVISMFIISIFYNLCAVICFKTSSAIAFATLFTLVTWVIYSSKDLKNIKNDKRMYVYMFSLTASFLIISHICDWLVGIITYLIIYFLLTFIFNREIIIDIKEILLKNKTKLIKNKQ